MARRSTKAKPAPVGKYDERSYEDAKADPADIVAVEDRQPDQIADYHKDHPTLKPGPAHEADIPTDDSGDAQDN